MSFTLADGLLAVMAVALAVIAVYVIRVARQVSETVDAVRQLARNADAALSDLRRTGGRVDRIVETVEQGSVLVRQMFLPVSWRLGALAAGAKAGFGVLWRGTSHHGNGTVVARGGVK